MKSIAPRRAAPAGVPVLLAAVGSVLWLWHTPPVGDLAAQTAWSQLVERAGYVPWFSRWYGGVPVGGYSLTAPGLMALIGVRTVAVLAAIATVGIAVLLLRSARHPLLGACGFAAAAVADLYSGRVTFAVGGAIALASVLASERRKPKTAVGLAFLCAVTSPIAAVFLLIPFVAWALTDPSRRTLAVTAAITIALSTIAVAVVFPVGGREPFAFFVFRPAFEIPLVAALFPVGRRVRLGLLLAALAIALSYFVTGPMGSNSTRLAILVAIPAFAAACRLPALWVLLASVVLAIWPWHQLHDELVAARDPSAQRAYAAGLEARLAADPIVRTQRVEVVDTRSHTATATLADRDVTLARGWVRQVDEGRNPLFYGRSALTAGTYRQWLDAQAVAYVAMPKGALLDFGSVGEAALIARGLPYLQLVWSDPSWSLYAVRDPSPVATGVAQVTDLTDTGAVLSADRAGRTEVKVRWSRWLVVDGGTVHRGPHGDGTITVDLRSGGTHRLHAVWR